MLCESTASCGAGRDALARASRRIFFVASCPNLPFVSTPIEDEGDCCALGAWGVCRHLLPLRVSSHDVCVVSLPCAAVRVHGVCPCLGRHKSCTTCLVGSYLCNSTRTLVEPVSVAQPECPPLWRLTDSEASPLASVPRGLLETSRRMIPEASTTSLMHCTSLISTVS